MDAIPGLRATPPVTPGPARANPAAAGFNVPAGGAPPSSVAAAPVGLAGLLVLQEAGDDQARDRDARRRGRDLLEELAGLQRDLLDGAPDPARLARLAELANALPPAADPGLRDVVQAIALRARVEAARYQTA